MFLAILPLFPLGPTTALSLIGHFRGARPVRLPDRAAVQELDIDVVIPAFNESTTIALCLASVMRQTVKPASVTVIDDGSDDDTAGVADAFAALHNFPIRVIRRQRSIGKTPSLKTACRELEGDVEFVLDADTVLMSEDYIEQVAAHLYRVPGIASACGMVSPLRHRDRVQLSQFENIRRLRESRPALDLALDRPLLNRIAKEIAIFIYVATFQFIQAFFYSGVLKLFGSLPNPVGCAVAYRRNYLREVFDHYEPAMGDNLTSSEDIFIGTAFMAAGYHNIQVSEVLALTEVPELHRIPKQLVKWSSAWLQTAYYLPDMLFSPFRALRRLKHKRRNAAAAEKRRIVDGYRQPFGLRHAKELGRPSGWLIFCGLFEKVSQILLIWTFIVLAAWWPLAATVTLDAILFTVFLIVVSKGRRLEFAVKGVVATPFRYGMLVIDAAVMAIFVCDIVSGRRNWRK